MSDGTSSTRQWVKAVSLADLESARVLVRKFGTKQLAFFATPKGAFACNNRCPHEGYPLAEGTLDDRCRLTCNWHNWKFDLANGANEYGGDALRVYPLERRGGDLWVDLTDPPAAERQAAILAQLKEAVADNEDDRIARELARYEAAGGEVGDALAEIVVARHAHIEFGWTHAFAGMADWLALRDGVEDGEAKLICLVEPLAHLAEDSLREPAYPYSDERRHWDVAGFLEAVERQDETAAVAYLNGGLNAGLGVAAFEPTLARAAFAHYADFGHLAIYLDLLPRLIGRLGQKVEGPLLRGLVRNMVRAFREDLLPEFRAYRQALSSFAGDGSLAGLEQGNAARAMKLVAAAGSRPPLELWRALLTVNARRLLDFDLSFDRATDRPVTDNASWLDVTHGLTFARAVGNLCTKFPELWPAGLLQMACFAGRNLPFAGDRQELASWQVDDPDDFFRAQRQWFLDHAIERDIVVVHRLKTLFAVEAMLPAVGEVAPLLLAALNRYLSSPLKAKHVRRTAQQALAFVAREG